MIGVILLAAAAADPSAIVITGRGLPPGEMAGAAVVTIDRERIEHSASGRLEDVLRDVAGVQSFRRSDSRSTHATNQSITLRGLGGNASARALLIVDGVPQNDPFGGWISFPAYSTDRIGLVRITRGGGSGYNGPGALAGTVEVETAAPSEGNSVRAAAAYGSRDSIDTRASLLTASSSRSVMLSGAFARGDGFVPITDATRGPIDRAAPYRQASGAARLLQQVGDAEVQANVSGFFDRRDRGVPFTRNRGKGIDTSLRIVGQGGTRWSLLSYAQFRNFASQFSSVNDARTASTETLDQFSVPSRGVGFRGELAPLGGPIDLRLGVDGRFVRGETKENYQFVTAAPTRRREAGGRSSTLGAFAVATLDRTPWTISASARADRWSIGDGHLLQRTLTGTMLDDIRFADRSGWQASGRVAGQVRVAPQAKVRVAAYRGWRLPTLNELYRPFRAGPDATAPNAALRPEEMLGGEAGVDLDLGNNWQAAITAYRADLHRAIANVTLSSGPGTFPIVGFVSAAGAYRQRQNLDFIRSTGIEADIAGKMGPLDARLSYAFIDARVHASGPAAVLDGKRPAQTPLHHLSATLGWRSPGRAALSLTARALSAQYDDDLNQRRLHAAVTLDLYGAMPINRRLAIELRAENLANRTVEAARAADGTVERALPRTLWFGLRLR